MEIITATFTTNSTFVTGLSPTVTIQNLDNGNTIKTDVPMVEVGLGLYKYNFSQHNDNTNYYYRADGGSTLSFSERYKENGEEIKKTPIYQVEGAKPAELSKFVLEALRKELDSLAKTDELLGLNENIVRSQDFIESQIKAIPKQEVIIQEKFVDRIDTESLKTLENLISKSLEPKKDIVAPKIKKKALKDTSFTADVQKYIKALTKKRKLTEVQLLAIIDEFKKLSIEDRKDLVKSL